jgi:hypothetical protein
MRRRRRRLSEKASVEVLRAFAASKPTEFDGFLFRWAEEHPKVEEPVELPVEEPKKSSRRKKSVEPASDTAGSPDSQGSGEGQETDS